jgi:hypothetical protein
MLSALHHEYRASASVAKGRKESKINIADLKYADNVQKA